MARKSVHRKKQKRIYNGQTKGQSINTGHISLEETELDPCSEAMLDVGTDRERGVSEEADSVEGESESQKLAALSAYLPAIKPPTRRRRVQRLLNLKRRRRQGRAARRMVPGVLTGVLSLLGVVLVLLSGSFGAAFAYYQTRLPLLKGIA